MYATAKKNGQKSIEQTALLNWYDKGITVKIVLMMVVMTIEVVLTKPRIEYKKEKDGFRKTDLHSHVGKVENIVMGIEISRAVIIIDRLVFHDPHSKFASISLLTQHYGLLPGRSNYR